MIYTSRLGYEHETLTHFEGSSRYLKANRKEKTKILDEYCANTGYNRKYAIWKLNLYQMHEKDRPRRKVRRDRKYGLDVQKALEKT